ncbi:MAG: hypothetical protein QOH25_2252 [Acidobacteriota bacterium]|jgi:hypothetical protein|nr:hypothetical protein [Acidobacteriota bacterium]
MRKLFTSLVTLFPLSFTNSLILAVLIVASAGLSLFISNKASAQDKPSYYRLQLKHGRQYLDAEYCSTKVGLNPGSDYEDGACQLWRLVPAGDGWSRLQLKHGGQYLDAEYCSTKVGLNPGSNYEDGACQLWRLIPVGDGWSRLQLKHGGQYLDADHCSTKIGLNPGSDYEDGACQLWRLVPVE